MLQEFISLVERYEPDYASKILGASPDEIRHLEQLVGCQLPACYREFLLLMGKSMASLHIEGLNFNIDRIMKFYLDGEWIPPAGYILFGVQSEDPGLDYYLECSTPEALDCPIVRFPSEGTFSRLDYFYPLDPSLEEFLLALAFSEKRMEALDLERVLSPSTRRSTKPAVISNPGEIARLIDERARQMGFERVAPSSKVYRFYDHKDAAIYERFDESDGNLVVTLACRTSRDLERIGDGLCNGTSLVAA